MPCTAHCLIWTRVTDHTWAGSRLPQGLLIHAHEIDPILSVQALVQQAHPQNIAPKDSQAQHALGTRELVARPSRLLSCSAHFSSALCTEQRAAGLRAAPGLSPGPTRLLSSREIVSAIAAALLVNDDGASSRRLRRRRRRPGPRRRPPRLSRRFRIVLGPLPPTPPLHQGQV